MDELLALRLGLIAVVFVFLAAVAWTMRGGLRPAPTRAHTPARPGARFVVTYAADTGIRAGAVLSLAGTMTLGRDADSGNVLDDPSVSARHAEARRTPMGWTIRDLGSTNGTFVDGRPGGREGVALHGGEEIALGSVVLRFEA